MSDEKKPGFFKRLFGFGKSTPEPAPAPEPAVSILEDENAKRIAAEIEAARQEAQRQADQEAEQARQAHETARLAEAKAAEALKQKQAQEEATRRELEEAKKQKAEAAEHARIEAEREKAAKLEAERQEAAARAEELRQQALKADALKQAEAKQLAEAEAAKAEAAKAAANLQQAADAAAKAAQERAEAEARTRSEQAQADARRLAEEQARQAEVAAQARLAEEAKRAEEARLAEQGKLAEQARLAEQERLAEEARRAAAAVPVPAPVAPPPAPITEAPKTSWWQKLKQGLAKTASSVSEGITSVFTKRKLDDETLEELEDILIQADLGIDVAARISAAVGKGRYDKEIDPQEVKAIMAAEVAKVLDPVALPLIPNPGRVPYIILMIGVNGSGKTTTIGKMAAKFKAEGKTVMLAAGDTFRAAAIEQLKIWGERTGVPVIARDQGGDAAGLAFDAVKAAQEQGVDILLIDTAGRLQNRTELMAELEKVIRVIKKLDDAAPHATLLVLDATVGQNALSQVDIFGKTAGVTGLVMTKLDGTARGGILVAIAEKFRLPVHFIGVGEGVDDLEPFEAMDFARAIAGLEQLKA